MTARSPRVLVSILNYRAFDDTVATASSLGQQDYENYHLQIVDNASPNDSVAQLRAQLPDVALRVTDHNLGYCGGNNFALRQALSEGYDYVVVCNDDIEVAPSAIRHLVEAAEAHEDAGVIGAVEVCHFTSAVRAVRGTRFSLWTSRAQWSTELAESTSTLGATYVQGAMVMFTRRALEAGVFMNEDLFGYYDEADIGFRLQRAGLRAYVDTRVHVRHKNREKYFNVRSGYLHQRNRVYIVRRYGRWYHRVAFHLGMTLVELPAKTIVRSLQGRTGFARACLLGYADGVSGRMGKGRIDAL